MEWGGYGDKKTGLNGPTLLPWTIYDQTLDAASLHPDTQLFEKMISGKYQGEIVRLICLDLIQQGLLFGGLVPEKLHPDSLNTAHMSIIEANNTCPQGSIFP